MISNFLHLLLPKIAHAQGLIPASCVEEPCEWGQLVLMVQIVIHYLILIAGSLAAISFCYAGWLYITSAGDEGKVKTAKGIFLKVIIGLIFVLSAWLIVHEIVKSLGLKQDSSLIQTS